MQSVSKGLEKVEQELSVSENDGPASAGFRKVCVWKPSNLFILKEEVNSIWFFLLHELDICLLVFVSCY